MSIKGVFLIGSGPSLNKIDVSFLCKYDSIAFNRSYVAWSKWGFDPTYYACFDELAIADNYTEIDDLIKTSKVKRFFLNSVALQYGITASEKVTMVSFSKGSNFSRDLKTIADYGNVGASSLQVLVSLGYKRIVFVGVDARYSYGVSGAVLVDGIMCVTHDKNHFCEEYSKGKKNAVVHNVDRLLGKWPFVAKECNRVGVDIVNASEGSALSSFKVMSFPEACAWVKDE